jgi:hypothetical protein
MSYLIAQIINVYGMIPTGKPQSTRRETCFSVIFFFAKMSTGTGVESNPGLRVEKKATNLVNNGTVLLNNSIIYVISAVGMSVTCI